MAIDRVATTDPGYQTGDLSLYPAALDDVQQLYAVSNNGQTVTTMSAGFSAKAFNVEDTSSFPGSGLIRVGTEVVYYANTTPTSFYNLKRGFVGSRQQAWPVGTAVTAAVFAEPHNAVKDAITNMEANFGLVVNPSPTSLNGILVAQEQRFLSPQPVFRAAPRQGSPPLAVTFQNFTPFLGTRFFWEFGDGATSVLPSPTHVYRQDGIYSVKLTMVNSLGAQGISYKNNYITVAENDAPSFFYFTPASGTTATTFSFVDQTEGEITARYWSFGDGGTLSVTDPDNHTATHAYSAVGTYSPSLMLVFKDNSQRVVQAEEPITVLQ